ncbi:hypothetical protein HaLaN_03354, partial [Haematococcus lacustris]
MACFSCQRPLPTSIGGVIRHQTTSPQQTCTDVYHGRTFKALATDLHLCRGHRGEAWSLQSCTLGWCPRAGAVGEPPSGATFVWSPAASEEDIRRFVQSDVYVTAGL